MVVMLEKKSMEFEFGEERPKTQIACNGLQCVYTLILRCVREGFWGNKKNKPKPKTTKRTRDGERVSRRQAKQRRETKREEKKQLADHFVEPT